MPQSCLLSNLKPKPDEDRGRYAAQGLAVLLPAFLVAGRAVADGALTLTALLFLAHCVYRRRWEWLKEPWVRMTFGLWAWLIFVSLTGNDPLLSLSRSVVWIRFPVFAAALTFWVADRTWFERFIWVASLTLGFVVFDTLLQYVVGQDLFGFPAPDSHRLSGPFNKNKQAGIFLTRLAFLPTLPLFVSVVRSGQKSKAMGAIGAFFVLALTIFLTNERMAFLLLLLGLILTFLLIPVLRRWLLVLGLTVAVGVGAVFLLNPVSQNRHINQTSAIVTHFSKSQYGQAWLNAVRITMQHPVLGIGPKNFRNACTCKDLSSCGENDVPCFLHPHNVYLEWAAETGLPGLCGFLMLVGLWLMRMVAAFRNKPPPFYALGGWVALCLGLWPVSAVGSFFSNWNEGLFWLAVAVALAGTEMAMPSVKVLPKQVS